MYAGSFALSYVSFSTHSFSDYGTVLYINTVEHTADGRSLITTTGEKRFQVLRRSSCDGYNTAQIRFIVDEPVIHPEEIGELIICNSSCGAITMSRPLLAHTYMCRAVIMEWLLQYILYLCMLLSQCITEVTIFRLK